MQDIAHLQFVWWALLGIPLTACGVGGLLGLYAMINPRWASRLVRLTPMEGKVEGKSEFRATYGGLFFFSHMFAGWAIFSGYSGWMLGIGALGAAWLGSCVGRLLSIAVDRTGSILNWINVGIEAALGVALLLPLFIVPGLAP